MKDSLKNNGCFYFVNKHIQWLYYQLFSFVLYIVLVIFVFLNYLENPQIINLTHNIYFKFYFHHCVLRNEMNKTRSHLYILKKFLNQFNLLNIYICLYLQHDKNYRPCELMSCIMDCDHSVAWNDILKFVYWFMILFLIYL
jgi:hypothetical protein